MSLNATIYVDHLSFCYQKNEAILNDIVLEIKPSARIALIGRNGSGKTTLVETILGLNKPTKGRIVFPQQLASSVGCVLQDVSFDNEISISRIFNLFIKLAKISNNQVHEPTKEQLNEIFVKYELADKLNRRFSSLSAGQRQKFKLMLCLELRPKVLLLDELTTSLDYEWRAKIIKLIKRYLNSYPETILVLVSHSRDEIENLTNEYYLLENKKISKITDLDLYFKV